MFPNGPHSWRWTVGQGLLLPSVFSHVPLPAGALMGPALTSQAESGGTSLQSLLRKGQDSTGFPADWASLQSPGLSATLREQGLPMPFTTKLR